LKSVFQLIFHYTTKHRKIIHFPGIHFPKENYFPANKRGLKKFQAPKYLFQIQLKINILRQICFCVSKVFFKKIIFFIFSLLQINIFLVFSTYFNVLISKMIFKNKKYYFNAFPSEKHLKNNHNHTPNTYHSFET